MAEKKGCGCGKKNLPPTPPVENPPQNNTETPQFRTAEAPDAGIKKKLTMIQSFATAMASRGISDNKVHKAEKQLRVLSCFGNRHENGVLPPCEHLKKSTVQEGQYYCGACGCGDKKMTWLLSNSDEYSKLDYPKLSCPLSMPGFSNYNESENHESQQPITRKYYIENMNYQDVAKVEVSLPEAPIEIEVVLDNDNPKNSNSQE